MALKWHVWLLWASPTLGTYTAWNCSSHLLQTVSIVQGVTQYKLDGHSSISSFAKIGSLESGSVDISALWKLRPWDHELDSSLGSIIGPYLNNDGDDDDRQHKRSGGKLWPLGECPEAEMVSDSVQSGFECQRTVSQQSEIWRSNYRVLTTEELGRPKRIEQIWFLAGVGTDISFKAWNTKRSGQRAKSRPVNVRLLPVTFPGKVGEGGGPRGPGFYLDALKWLFLQGTGLFGALANVLIS